MLVVVLLISVADTKLIYGYNFVAPLTMKTVNKDKKQKKFCRQSCS